MYKNFEASFPEIKEFFRSNKKAIYTERELSKILSENKRTWRLKGEVTVGKFIDFLLDRAKLKRLTFKSTSKQKNSIIRYAWKEVSPYQVGLSLKTNSYLSHGTAVFLHGLNEQIPKKIYVNQEQKPKSFLSEDLTQQSIDDSFKKKQRVSQNEYKHKGYSYMLLNGKFTGNLEVHETKDNFGETVFATSLERTLIDITVRPFYAGGIYQVLEAFKGAKEREFSIGMMISILKKMGHQYPYHQAIGFYMERAGYENKKVDRLKRLGMSFNFYLDYNMEEPEFNESWKLFVPKHF